MRLFDYKPAHSLGGNVDRQFHVELRIQLKRFRFGTLAANASNVGKPGVIQICYVLDWLTRIGVQSLKLLVQRNPGPLRLYLEPRPGC